MTYLLPSSSQIWPWTIFISFTFISCLSISLSISIVAMDMFNCHGIFLPEGEMNGDGSSGQNPPWLVVSPRIFYMGVR